MKTLFITKGRFLVSSIFRFWLAETGIDLSLIKTIFTNAAVVTKAFTYHFPRVSGLLK